MEAKSEKTVFSAVAFLCFALAAAGLVIFIVLLDDHLLHRGPQVEIAATPAAPSSNEITPAMLKAGSAELCRSSIELCVSRSKEDVARAVFQSMIRERDKSAKNSSL